MFRVILFVVGLTLSCVAAFYSVTGLAFVFAGAFWPVIIMGSTLEAAKVAAASWVFRHWRDASKALVVYLSLGVVLLMLLTGIGIFGYLSRAYLIQQAPIARLQADRDLIERSLTSARGEYTRDEARLKELSAGQTTDSIVNKLAENNRLSGRNGAVTLLRQQQELRAEAQKKLTASSDHLSAIEKTAATLDAQIKEASVDVGPLMFAAKAYYGNSDLTTMDKVVTAFILLILAVFDPMAIALLLAAQSSLRVSAPVHSQITDAVTTPRPTDEHTEWEQLVEKVSEQIAREDERPIYQEDNILTRAAREETFNDLSEQRVQGRETFEPTTIVELTSDVDTEDIAAAELPKQLPLERPNVRGRRTRTAPKQ